MTSETLKPFLTPQSVDNFPAAHSSMANRKRSSHFLTIGLSLTGIALVAVLLGFTIWSTIRINTLESDVYNLTRVIESMQNRLGLNYLDDLHDFEKEYTNALIDNPNTNLDNDNDVDDEDEDTNINISKISDVNGEDEEKDDDLDNDDDIDEEDDFEYDDLGSYDDYMKKIKDYTDDDDDDFDDDENDNSEETNISEDDNIYDNFEKFQDSIKKPEAESRRKTRSIPDVSNELVQQDEVTTSMQQTNKNPINENALIGPNTNETNQQQHNHTHTQTQRTHKHKRIHKYHQFVAENVDGKRSPLRIRSQRKHKHLMLKSGESLISAKSAGYMNAPLMRAAAHYHLNRKVADRYAPINVDSYSGDLYIGHPSWTNEISADNYFTVENGLLTVHEPGLYYVYAQVCYNNTHDQNGFVIFHGHKPFLQCLNTVPTNMPHKIHTCHTSGLIFLKENETVHLRDFHSDRNVILKDMNNRSYFGLIKI